MLFTCTLRNPLMLGTGSSFKIICYTKISIVNGIVCRMLVSGRSLQTSAFDFDAKFRYVPIINYLKNEITYTWQFIPSID